MNDTNPKIAKKFHDMMIAKTPAERLMMACDMFDFSREIVEGSIREENPNISRSDMRRQLFLRFYGHEFDESSKEKILSFLGN